MATEKKDPFEGKSYAERLTQPADKPTPDRRDKPMTYRIGEDLVRRINDASAAYHVEKSGLVKVLLSFGLDALDAGDLTLDIPPKKYKLD